MVCCLLWRDHVFGLLYNGGFLSPFFQYITQFSICIIIYGLQWNMPNTSTSERIDSHITEVHIPTLWSFHSPTLAVETSEEPWRPCRRFGNTQRSFGHIQLEAVRAYVKSQKVWNTRKRHPTSLWSYPRLVIGNASRIRAALEAFDRLWLLVCWQISTFNPSNQVRVRVDWSWSEVLIGTVAWFA